MQKTIEQAAKVAGEWFDRLMVALSVFGAVLILFMALLISYDVLMRRIFDAPLAWGLDITEFALLYATFLAAPIVLKREGHVRMTAVIELLKPTPRQLLFMAGMFAASIASGIIAWQSLFAFLDHLERGSKILGGIQVPQAAVTVIIPFGFLMLSLQAMRMAIASFTAFLRHEDPKQTSSSGLA